MSRCLAFRFATPLRSRFSPDCLDPLHPTRYLPEPDFQQSLLTQADFQETLYFMSFAPLGLMPELMRALVDAGYETPTPVQAQAIPVVLQGRDVLAGAQTGTGKTAGFTLPLLQRLMAARNQAAPKPELRTPSADAVSSQNPKSKVQNRVFRPVRALILTPTRELAAQIEESVRTYGRYLPMNSAVIYGGVSINPQIEALRRGVDILVATPGRLLDHVSQRTLDLSRVEILVLDEADRMLDMGFIRDIRKILALLPSQRQNLLFSATFSDEIKNLADGLLHNPAHVEVARRNAESELVTQSAYLVAKDNKRDLLVYILAEDKVTQALVFTRTKHGADRLAKQLQRDGIVAVPIHGDRSQPQRTRALADFKAGRARVMVATDIAARGLDIDQLPHVFNYELPNVPEDYVHRIGRTGRAGSPGEAISLVSPDEQAYLRDIEKLIRKPIARREAAGFTPPPSLPRSEGDWPRSGERPHPGHHPSGNPGCHPQNGSRPSGPHPARPLPDSAPGHGRPHYGANSAPAGRPAASGRPNMPPRRPQRPNVPRPANPMDRPPRNS